MADGSVRRSTGIAIVAARKRGTRKDAGRLLYTFAARSTGTAVEDARRVRIVLRQDRILVADDS